MSQQTVTAWEPLPMDVAEWMGATEMAEGAREGDAAIVVVPRAKG